MRSLSKLRKAELNLARRSQRLTEDESRLVARDHLARTITEFIEWRAFSYWLRLTIETQGRISDSVIATLRGRCHGFLIGIPATLRIKAFDTKPGV